MKFSDEAESCAECLAEEFTIRDGLISDPGKFEAETLVTFHAYHVMLDGFADDDDAAEWRIGNVICAESEQGFVSCDIYESDEAAREVWDKLETADYVEQY